MCRTRQGIWNIKASERSASLNGEGYSTPRRLRQEALHGNDFLIRDIRSHGERRSTSRTTPQCITVGVQRAPVAPCLADGILTRAKFPPSRTS